MLENIILLYNVPSVCLVINAYCYGGWTRAIKLVNLNLMFPHNEYLSVESD